MYYILPKNSFLKDKPNEKMLSVVINGIRSNLVINETAYDILKYCDGKWSLDNICEELSQIYLNPEEIIKKYIENSIKSGLIKPIDEFRKEDSATIKGSTEFFFPDILIWEITNNCPLLCKHCYLGEKENVYFDREGIDKIISLIKNTGVTTVQLTGGEIFTHPNIEYIVEKLNELDIILSLSTSGYILNDKVRNVIKSLHANATVRISIDGNKEYHDANRGKRDSYDKAMKFIEFVRESNISVQIGTVIINQSEDMIETLIKNSRDRGVSLHSFSVVLEEGNAIKNNQKSKIKNMQLQRKLVEWSEKFNNEVYKIQTSHKDGQRNCGCGYKLIRIKPDYTITPCPMIENSIGNLISEEYESIMKRGSDIFANIYSPMNCNKNNCKDCYDQEECGECIALALANNKKTEKKCSWINSNKKIEDFIAQ